MRRQPRNRSSARRHDEAGRRRRARAFFDAWVSPRAEQSKARALYVLETEIEHEFAADANRPSRLRFDAVHAERGSEFMLKGGDAPLVEAFASDLDVRLSVVVTLGRALVGRHYFAGEHTCPTNPATTHGAWQSGLRAAANVVAT